MATRALILRAVDRHIGRADQRILVRLIALGMIGRGLIDLGRRLNHAADRALATRHASALTLWAPQP